MECKGNELFVLMTLTIIIVIYDKGKIVSAGVGLLDNTFNLESSDVANTTPTYTTATSASFFFDGSGFVIASEAKATSSKVDIETMKNLTSLLLDDYDTRLRPRWNQSHTVEVNCSFALNSIVKIDTTGQQVVVIGYFIVSWTDELLSWNPDNFNGADTVKLPLKNVWFPPLMISKASDDNKVIGNIDIDRVGIEANGKVHWVPDGILNFMCEVSVKYYPFDVQVCELIFYVSDETKYTVQLNSPENILLKDYTKNSEWRLLSAEATTREVYHTNFVYLSFKVETRADFTVYTMLVPLIALALINVFTFLIPIESGEKGSLAITLFLAYGFFISITRNGLPHNSIQISYYIVYITILLILSLFTVIYVIIESRIYFSCGEKVVGTFNHAGAIDTGEEATTEKSDEIYRRGAQRVGGEQGGGEEQGSSREKLPTWTDVLGKIDLFFCILSAVSVTLISTVLWTLVITRN